MTRTIQSPGFQFQINDNSQYINNVDQSLQNAPVCFIAGYADSGIDFFPNVINNTNVLNEIYGQPTTDEEYYFYNGITEILKHRAICIAAKLPYDNKSKNKFSYVDYKITKADLSLLNISTDLKSIDDKFETYGDITYSEITSNQTNRISIDELNKYRINSYNIDKENAIRIVDITHKKYAKANFNCVKTKKGDKELWTNECLGIIPVITTPINAMYVQNLFEDTTEISNYNNVSEICLCKEILDENNENNEITVDLSNFEKNSLYQLSSDNKNIETISTKTARLFPKLVWKSYSNKNVLNQKYNKCIGLVVLKAFVDNTNNGVINYSVLESYVGKLDKNENSDIPFIEQIVNENSNYINIFTNINQDILDNIQFTFIQNQKVQSLGFFDFESEKIIDGKKLIENDLQTVFSKISNTQDFPIDLVIDGGISNIAEKYRKTIKEDNTYSYKYQQPNGIFHQTFENFENTVNWRKALEQFSYFCERTRGDCMFIADCLKSFSLNENEKIVNNSNFSTNDTIISKLKYLPQINSSYAAGYCNWIKTIDSSSGFQFWCPPSIKVLGTYIYCSIYKYDWTAPAGIQNTKIDNVLDLSFNPNNNNAENLYLNNWNYFVNYPTYGIIIEGQKTFQIEATALDRINVRRMMLYLERSILQISRKYLYQLNTQKIRDRFANEVQILLESIKNGIGISEYSILCDESINTPQTIDNNELRLKIAVKPVKAIEYILVSFILTNQSMQTNEEILRN